MRIIDNNIVKATLDKLGIIDTTFISFRGSTSSRNSLISLIKCDISGFNITSLKNLFYHCENLIDVPALKEWDTSNIVNMSNMFDMCSSLKTLDLSHFDTSNVSDMSNMFSDCRSLTSLDVSNFDTSNVTDMSWMFYKCYSLPALDVSKFNTSKIGRAHV